jgi:hypothetical protein
MKKLGYQIHLVTASGSKVGRYFYEKYYFFDYLHCSNSQFKLKGRKKASYLKKKFDGTHFIYIGDSFRDIHVWRISSSGFFPKRFFLKFLFAFMFVKIRPI